MKVLSCEGCGYPSERVPNRWVKSFLTLYRDLFIFVYDEFSLLYDDLSHGCGQKGGSDYGDVSPVLLGSKESRDPPTVGG